MGYSRPPKKDDGRIKVDPRERGGFNKEPKPGKRKIKPLGPTPGKRPEDRKQIRPKPPITIQPVPKKPGRTGRSGR